MENNNLYAKLNVIRLELSKDLQKSGKNTYSKYDYFQLKDFMPKAIELCNREGIFTKFWIGKEAMQLPSRKTTQNVVNENGEVTGTVVVEEENFQYVEYAYLRVIDVETGAEELFKKETRECQVQAAQPIQNLGSKSTYMKRYMYIDVFEINENDAIEENTGKPDTTEAAPKTTRSRKPKVEAVSTKAPEPVTYIEAATVEDMNVVNNEPTAAEMVQAMESKTVDTEALMSMETKLELANKIKEAGLDPREEILNIAKELGTDVPLLKESDKDKVLEILNKKVGK